jgi:hypothetical protein
MVHSDGWGVISVADHVTEPPEIWRSRVPTKYREPCPKLVERGDGGFAGTSMVPSRCSLASCARSTYPRRSGTARSPAAGTCIVPPTTRRPGSRTWMTPGSWHPFPTMPGFAGTYLNRNPDRELNRTAVFCRDLALVTESTAHRRRGSTRCPM